jgi:dTDP-4-dehydrorhamnose reductase
LKTLTAGAAGQLGRCVERVLETHQRVILDHNALDVGDLDHGQAVESRHRHEIVINASAFNDVDGVEWRIEEAFLLNGLGPRNLALATGQRGIPLVHISTDYVFDGANRRPYNELDPPNPSVYGASKLAGEKPVQSHHARHYIVRTAWLFSEYGKNLLLSVYAKASLPQLDIENERYGSPTNVPHLAEGIKRLIQSGCTERITWRAAEASPDGVW